MVIEEEEEAQHWLRELQLGMRDSRHSFGLLNPQPGLFSLAMPMLRNKRRPILGNRGLGFQSQGVEQSWAEVTWNVFNFLPYIWFLVWALENVFIPSSNVKMKKTEGHFWRHAEWHERRQWRISRTRRPEQPCTNTNMKEVETGE